VYAATILLNVILLNVIEPKIGIKGFFFQVFVLSKGVLGVEYFYFALKNAVN
jgi:hypothetical protein